MNRPLVLSAALLLCLSLDDGPTLGARQTPPAAQDPEQRLVERLLADLEKNTPRPDLLERVYGFHVERGTTEDLLGRYRKRVEANPKDGRAWLLLGLFEAQRGLYAAAADALGKAEPLLPNEALVPYHRGRVLVLLGRTEEAAAALEAAVPRTLPAEHLLNAYQLLRRAYQQLDRPEKAARVLDEVRRKFAAQRAVQQRIAGELNEEGRYVEAREIYDQLEKGATDPLDRAELAMAAADMAARQGLKAESVRRCAALIGKLPPDAPAAAEARRRLEEVFLRDGDAAGAVRYYEGLLQKDREDPDVLARLAHLLVLQGRSADARARLELAVKRAPGRADFRHELIRLLVAANDVPAAIRQYEELDRLQKDNREVLREWGKLLLRDPSKPEEERKAAAARVWRRIAASRPKDPQAALE
jgi:tetratricopeptide (TPR) repeat protein